MTSFTDSAITYDELSRAIKGVFPQLSDDELSAAMFAIWARVLLTRIGIVV